MINFGKDKEYPNISPMTKIIGDTMRYLELAMFSGDVDLIAARMYDLGKELEKHYTVEYKNEE